MVSRITLGCAAVLALVAVACDTVPLTAPSGSSLTLTTASTIVPTGGTTELKAFVAEEGGIAVQNGTIVYFATNLGRMEPAEAQTRNGFAVTTFIAGESSGVATVIASSGGTGSGSTPTPTTPPSTGNGTPPTTPTTPATPGTGSSSVQITVGGAASEAVVLNASSTSVPSGGGTVTLTASVVDINGNRLRNTPINFSTTAGSLSATVATTDANGDARVDLNTNRNATVTARAGSKTATLEITVSTPATLLLGADPSSLTGLGTVTLTAVVLDASGNRLSNVPVSFSTNAGTLSASIVTTNANGEARSELTTSATATVTARAGTTTATAVVSVVGTVVPTPATIDLDATPPTVVAGQPVQLTATVQDTTGARVSNVTVTFTVSAGGGTLTRESAVTDSAGQARSQLTTSTSSSGTVTVTARVNTLTRTFNITVTPAPTLR
jgi:hypothetical protein